VERLRRFAGSELPVLILGENGTGKELAARFVHESSARRGRDPVPFNCAGLSESLQLSELFGHARGAFTGADRAHVGVFEQAQGTSLFLDEIGDLPPSAQGAILRALQEREVRRVGESVPRRVDVRVIAATNRDLERMVGEERFRQDLFFRLKVATVLLPPLRERGDDVLLLAERFLEAERRRRPGLRLTAEARRALLAHAWPGNVRELKHVLEAAALLTDDGRIAPEHLDLRAAPPERTATAYHRTMEEARRRMVVEALAAAGGRRAAAARALGMSRQNFSYLAKRLGLG
jgi:anaerobic nitric oxide reductase transcription regulator